MTAIRAWALLGGLLSAIAGSAWGQGNVIPLLECVDAFEVSVNTVNANEPPRGLLMGTFGYFNLLSSSVTLPAGSADNFFLPGNPNRGQPATFPPGYVPMAFQAAGGAGRDLIWILGTYVAVAREGTRTCSALPVVPFLVPVPVHLVAGATAYGVELMKVLWLGPGPRPTTPLSAQAQVAEGLYSSGGGMRTQATTSISISNVRLTDTSVLADVTIVPTPSRTNYPVSIQLRDHDRLVVTKSMPIEVYNTRALSVTPSALPVATVNSLYAPVSLGAIGGTAPYAFEVSAGSLPPGITLMNGSLSGLPTGAGTYDFTITGSSADRCLARQSYTLVVGGPSCSVDASNQVSVTLGGFRRNLITGRWQQTVTLTHTGATAINAPVRVALQNLSPNATLFNAAGVKQCAAPQGRPFVTVNLGSEISLRPGQTVSVAFDFVNTTPGQAITYTPRVLAGGISQ